MGQDFNWMNLVNPEFYINLQIAGIPVGIYVVLFIVFAETGLFAGFFLPGDSLLFLTGIYSDALMSTICDFGNGFLNVTVLALLVAASGVIGNMFGYWFGYKSGTYLYKKEDTFLFRKKYLIQAHEFFEKHGGRAIIFARFLPIVRTFAPIIAGIVKMDKKKFMLYNIVSSVLWAFAMIFAGHYLNELFMTQFDIDLRAHIEKIVIGIVLITTFPVLLNMLKGKKVTEQEAIDEANDDNNGDANIFPN
ncbi:DedA family protein [Flavobacterium sp. RHBU_3]|uniref:DedA family protein n=1 Tax=Flavobacterium sp. RHBU_3 TaxID=3391184 RepID=UPI0039850539